LLWWTLKQSGKTDISSTSFGPISLRFGQPVVSASINPALLPEFDSVRKYFGSSTLYGVSRTDGFFFKFNYLAPAKTE
jgi:hypothetical protein